MPNWYRLWKLRWRMRRTVHARRKEVPGLPAGPVAPRAATGSSASPHSMQRGYGPRCTRSRPLTVNEFGSRFPGDPYSGTLAAEDERWEQFADLPEADGACPVLDPGTGRCELYTGRPLTCRVFGPPVRNEDGIGVCELCYAGASEERVFAGEMVLRHHELEEELNIELPSGETVIAWAVLPDRP